MALRLCVCGSKFDRHGKERLCKDCKTTKRQEASRNAMASYRDQFKSVKKGKIKIYNNECRGLKWNGDRSKKEQCGKKTGRNRFFCPTCFANADDYGMAGL